MILCKQQWLPPPPLRSLLLFSSTCVILAPHRRTQMHTFTTVLPEQWRWNALRARVRSPRIIVSYTSAAHFPPNAHRLCKNRVNMLNFFLSFNQSITSTLRIGLMFVCVSSSSSSCGGSWQTTRWVRSVSGSVGRSQGRKFDKMRIFQSLSRECVALCMRVWVCVCVCALCQRI